MTSSFRDRYPPPWRVCSIPAPGYMILAANDEPLCFIYANDGREEVKVRFNMKLNEARALADAIVNLANSEG